MRPSAVVVAAGAAAAAGAWLILAAQGEFQTRWLAGQQDTVYLVFLAGLAAVVGGWSIGRWGARRVGATLLKLTFPVVSIAIALVAAEYAARYALRDIRSSGDQRTYLAHKAAPVPRNALGFREHPIGPKHAYRIAIVGDSYTFGQGIADDERFSNLLQASLGSQFEVLNFGRSGDDMPQHLQVLETALSTAPDYVLLQLFINDFEVGGVRRPVAHALLPWPALEQRLLGASVLYDIFGGQWAHLQVSLGLTESYEHYMRRILGDAASPSSVAAFGMLRRFVERARGAGAGVGTVLFPNPEYLDRRYPFEYLHDRVRALCDEEQMPCVDLRPPFAAAFPAPHAMWVSQFDHHPNARANRRAAAAILEKFGGIWKGAAEGR